MVSVVASRQGYSKRIRDLKQGCPILRCHGVCSTMQSRTKGQGSTKANGGSVNQQGQVMKTHIPVFVRMQKTSGFSRPEPPTRNNPGGTARKGEGLNTENKKLPKFFLNTPLKDLSEWYPPSEIMHFRLSFSQGCE